MNLQPAIFLDRDGTLIEDKGYLKNPEQVKLYNFTIQALIKLQPHFQLFIITNQSGIAKGITTWSEVNNVNNHLLSLLNSHGILIKEIYVCPHQDEDMCNCKKPSAYFIQKALKSYKINKSTSYIIGDHPSDVVCGQNATINSIYVLTGHGQKHINELNKNTIICSDLLVAADYIININN